MKRTTRAALTLVLTCGLCVQLSAQASAGPAIQRHLSPIASETPVLSTPGLPIHQEHHVLAAQGSANPPAAVRQPSSKTRLITAIVCVTGLVVLGVMSHISR
jgi:hypothetical protein